MSEEQDPQLLKIANYLPEAPAPQPLPEGAPSHLKRVARPLRHVKYIPTKQLIYYSKNKEPTFTYDIKYKTPLKSNNVVVQVKSVGLNPVDLKIRNAYTSNFNYERGIGREYSGIVVAVGDKYKTTWKEGDEVCGIYFHPNSLGTVASDIRIDPSVDPIVRKPKNLNWEKSGSWLWTFGSAWQILKQCEKKLTKDSTVLIQGGASSVGLMCIQLLKQYYKVDNIAVICSGSAIKLTKNAGAELAINYTVNPDLPKVLQLLTTTGVYRDYDPEGGEFESREIPAKKIDVIIDTVGGYNLMAKVNDYLEKGGIYITTVGDYKADYRTDVYNSWNNPAMNARTLFGSVWSLGYIPFQFKPKPTDEWLTVGVDMLESGEIENIVDSVYDWRQYTKAEKYLKKGHAHGKVVLNIEDF